MPPSDLHSGPDSLALLRPCIRTSTPTPPPKHPDTHTCAPCRAATSAAETTHALHHHAAASRTFFHHAPHHTTPSHPPTPLTSQVRHPGPLRRGRGRQRQRHPHAGGAAPLHRGGQRAGAGGGTLILIWVAVGAKGFGRIGLERIGEGYGWVGDLGCMRVCASWGLGLSPWVRDRQCFGVIWLCALGWRAVGVFARATSFAPKAMQPVICDPTR